MNRTAATVAMMIEHIAGEHTAVGYIVVEDIAWVVKLEAVIGNMREDIAGYIVVDTQNR